MKLCIIKLGAKGDVIRTLCILESIKEKFPNSEITWIVKEKNRQLLENHPKIDKLVNSEDKTNEKFDILYNFDIDEEACKLALEIQADKKLGFYMNKGFPSAYNTGAEYYLNTLFDDELKKKNKKTYQEIMSQAAELEWKKQPCLIYLNEKDNKYAQDFVNKNKINTTKLIGIHIGAGKRWPSKSWHTSEVIDFIIKASEKYEILLFSGPDDSAINKTITESLKDKAIKIFQNNPDNTDREFTSLVNLCNVMICSDSLALHVSLAMKKPTIGLFFCTSPDEVEDYGLLRKIISPLLYDFFPEKSDQYSKELVKSISANQVLNEVEEILKK